MKGGAAVSDPKTPVPTPRFERIAGAAASVSRDLGHSYLGVEHLFLAMIRDRHAIPTQVLARTVDLDAMEAALLDLMSSDGYNTGTTNVAWSPE